MQTPHDRAEAQLDAELQEIHETAAAADAPITAVKPEAMTKLLDGLPGLVGALDRAIFDTSGQKMPFVLLVFTEGGACHATNFDAKTAVAAVKELAACWDEGEPTPHVPGV